MKNKSKIAVPKDAATIILLKGEKILWARRNPALKFLGGWHAFPGGKLEAADAEIKVENCENSELAEFIVCAVRETFEEVGVLLARGGEKLTKGQFASLHDDLISGRMTFGEILNHWGLRINAEDFFYTGVWTTPQFSPARFKTRFFLAVCPFKQNPYAAITELENVEFIEPKDALTAWENSDVLISPPVLITLQTLAQQKNFVADSRELAFKTDNKSESDKPKNIARKLLEKSQSRGGEIRYIELNPRVICFPLKTETLPPATHTNCFIVGGNEFVVIDAASPFADEQKSLREFVDSLIEQEKICRRLIITHSHRDHFLGVNALQKHIKEKYGLHVPIAAHSLTAESLKAEVEVDCLIEDGDVFELGLENGEILRLKAFHTPGHARGHLCFYDEESGFLLSGDNVVGAGSVLIAAPDGNMIDYLNSLETMKNLPNLKFLCGSHGAAIADAKDKIESYIAHRLERENDILRAISEGAKTKKEIVEKVYADVSPELWKFAEKSVEAHLEKLRVESNL